MYSFGHENTVKASIEARKRPFVSSIFKVMLTQISCFAHIFHKEINVTIYMPIITKGSITKCFKCIKVHFAHITYSIFHPRYAQ